MIRLAARLALLSILVSRYQCVIETASVGAALMVGVALVLALVLIGVDEAS